MRLIDAAIKDLEMIGDCRTCGNKTPFCDSNPDSCKGYKWRGAPPRSAAEENLPLAMEQLFEVDKIKFPCAFQGEGAYERFKKIASQFYGDKTYKFVSLVLVGEPREDIVTFTAEFWGV